MNEPTPLIVAIIQARMGSSRFPGKVLADIEGMPMIARVYRRAQKAQRPNQIIVATTTQETDDALEQFCLSERIPMFRGDPEDVLDRYYQAALQTSAEIVIRLTGDCPLLDPGVIDKTVDAFLSSLPDVDYASNRIIRTYPIGLDVEVMSMGVLEEATLEAGEAFEREHVTPFFYDRPGRYRVLSVESEDNHGAERWTVDTEEDLEFVRQIYQRLENKDDFLMGDVLSLLAHEPGLRQINQHVPQKDFRQVG